MIFRMAARHKGPQATRAASTTSEMEPVELGQTQVLAALKLQSLHRGRLARTATGKPYRRFRLGSDDTRLCLAGLRKERTKVLQRFMQNEAVRDHIRSPPCRR